MGHNNSKTYNKISMFLLFMPFLSMMTIRLLGEIIRNKYALRLIVHYLIGCVLSLLKSKKIKESERLFFLFYFVNFPLLGKFAEE